MTYLIVSETSNTLYQTFEFLGESKNNLLSAALFQEELNPVKKILNATQVTPQGEQLAH